MKNKNKKTIPIFKLCILLPILFLAVFLFPAHCLADSSLKISKVQFDGGEGKADEDFIEITNILETEINLDGYRLAKITSSENRSNIKSFSNIDIVPAGGKFIWANNHNCFHKTIGANSNTGTTISENNTIVIIYGDLENGIIIDSYKKEVEEEKKDALDEVSPYIGKVKINEIKAETSDEEFIEIINNSGENIGFNKWYIKDEKEHEKGSSGKYRSVSATENEKFIILSGSFLLNNDNSGDSVYLYDESKKLVDEVSYTGANSGRYYAFDGTAWRWTSQSTPGEENEFDKKLSGKIRKSEKIYANTYAEFEVSADKDAQKFTWDFGDNHKSYLKKTKHKYEKPGNYEGSLKITGEGEDALYNFNIEVEKYEAPKARIVKFSPNPKGSDTKNEWILIENKSKKKINLKGWSIAAGWDNLYNHPIRKDFWIKPGKTKKLTRKISAFTLNNEKTKLELRDPSGKTVQKIKYDRKKNKIEEDEVYEKIEGGWSWLQAQTDIDLTQTNADNTPADMEVAEVQVEDVATEKEIALEKIEVESEKIAPEGQVLGVEKENPPIIVAPPSEPSKEKSWTKKLLENSFQKINFWINKFILFF